MALEKLLQIQGGRRGEDSREPVISEDKPHKSPGDR